jgi:secreted Zn-dependent insulinase-like peptidase
MLKLVKISVFNHFWEETVISADNMKIFIFGEHSTQQHQKWLFAKLGKIVKTKQIKKNYKDGFTKVIMYSRELKPLKRFQKKSSTISNEKFL